VLIALYFVLCDRLEDEPEKIAINLPPVLPLKAASDSRESVEPSRDIETTLPFVEELNLIVLLEPTKPHAMPPTADQAAVASITEKPELTPTVDDVLATTDVASDTESDDKEIQDEPEEAQQIQEK